MSCQHRQVLKVKCFLSLRSQHALLTLLTSTWFKEVYRIILKVLWRHHKVLRIKQQETSAMHFEAYFVTLPRPPFLFSRPTTEPHIPPEHPSLITCPPPPGPSNILSARQRGNHRSRPREVFSRMQSSPLLRGISLIPHHHLHWESIHQSAKGQSIPAC